MVKQITDKADFEAVLKDNIWVVVDFTATWCGPCRMIGPTFVKMADEFTDVMFIKVDVDECEDVAKQCAINCMPTFQLFKEGKKVGEFSGASEDKLRELIESNKK